RGRAGAPGEADERARGAWDAGKDSAVAAVNRAQVVWELLGLPRHRDIGAVERARVREALPDPDRSELARLDLEGPDDRGVLHAGSGRASQHDVRRRRSRPDIQGDLHDERLIALEGGDLRRI